jgi:hypothetical protein
MTREQVLFFITNLYSYRDLNPGPLVSWSEPQTTRPSRQNVKMINRELIAHSLKQ